MTKTFEDVGQLVEMIVAEKGKRLKVGLPLGLGKPNHLINELVDRTLAGQIERLDIYTALSLSRPAQAENDLQRRLAEPMLDRLFGADYPDLKYVHMIQRGELPDSIRVHEFFTAPGAYLSSRDEQRRYKSVNYTDALREMKAIGLDLIAQIVAPAEEGWDLSCNSDLSVELFPTLHELEESERPLLVGQVNRRLPQIGGKSVLAEDCFDAVLDNEAYDFELFGPPNVPISDVEYAIGLRAASLLKDGGTIQIGIGGMGDAVSWAAILRHMTPGRYRELLDALGWSGEEMTLVDALGGLDPFEQGLHASSEMFVQGMLRMAETGVVRRRFEGRSIYGAFYLGPPVFYEKLRNLSEAMRDQIEMTSVTFTNLLYGNEEKKRAQRVEARFLNSAMMVTLLGAVVSDALEDGRVVSGVGGQYEFVAQANALEDGRSIIMVPATREKGGEVKSNIVFNYGHVTVPRHLRDMVITEYGIADIRGKSDEEIVQGLVCIADSRFQEELVEAAKASGKLHPDWEVPERHRNNLPERLSESLRPFREDGTIVRCPFGSALTEVELDLVEALLHLKSVVEDLENWQLPEISTRGLADAAQLSERWSEHLERLDLNDPETITERMMRRAVVYALSALK